LFVDYNNKIDRISTGKIIAIDRNIKLGDGIREFGSSFDGLHENRIVVPTFKRDKNTELKRTQRQMSNQTPGNAKWLKLVQKIHHIEERIYNRKLAFMRQLASDLVKEYDYIILEDLNIKEITDKENGKKKAAKSKSKAEENEKLTYSKQIRRGFSEVNHGEFQVLLKQKALEKGVTIIKVPPEYTSQECHKCHVLNKNLDLGIREWECQNCHTIHDRDFNAARNIYEKGINQIMALKTIKI
jgi:transposase